MKPMQCDRAGELIGAYLDQELDAGTRRAVATHLGGCPACSAVADDFGHLGRKLAAVGREPAPEHLATSVRALAGSATPSVGLRRFAAIDHWLASRWLRPAVALLLVCAVTAIVTALVMSRTIVEATLEREVAAAHVRSLLQDRPIQIASSDAHVVKPWFAGRLDFAPAVKDLTSVGFPLAGARLDYIGERRVAALVFRRRLHVVNVFIWPSVGDADSPPRELVHKGYNLVSWNKSGIGYYAISDLNMGELREIQRRL
jgi:anti-sigma factor RsiW